MPCAVVNDKGLFCQPGHASLSSESLEAVALACAGHELGRSFAERLRACCEPPEPTANGAAYPAGHAYALKLAPGGYGHSTRPWEVDSAALRDAWTNLAGLRADWNKARPCLARGSWPGSAAGFGAPKGPGNLGEALAWVEAFVPRASAMARHLAARFRDLPPGWQADGGDAFAIWMHGEKAGFMSDTKRPVGAASARLFESAEAARLKANALGFGLPRRGAAAIVRLRVEVVDILSSDSGASAHGPRMDMARREAEELRDSLDSASLDEITRALGLHPSPDSGASLGSEPGGAIAAEPPLGLAGRDEGCACWVDWGGSGPRQGFVNARGELGSLLGATLKATPMAAAKRSPGSGLVTVARVACQPVEIVAPLGSPNLGILRDAIAFEADAARAAALARQDRAILAARAQSLSDARCSDSSGSKDGRGKRRL